MVRSGNCWVRNHAALPIRSGFFCATCDGPLPSRFQVRDVQRGLANVRGEASYSWGSEQHIQAEVEKRVSNFHPEYYVFHNTFLELAVQRGVLGLGLYVWLMICLFRLGTTGAMSEETEVAFSNPHFRKLWPLLLGVYLLNASAVVMNYQFVNAVLFTIAGILAAQTSDRHELFGQPRSGQ